MVLFHKYKTWQFVNSPKPRNSALTSSHGAVWRTKRRIRLASALKCRQYAMDRYHRLSVIFPRGVNDNANSSPLYTTGRKRWNPFVFDWLTCTRQKSVMRLIVNGPAAEKSVGGERSPEQHETGTVNVAENPRASLHLLPCKIHRPITINGVGDRRQTFTAPVDRYFNPYTKGLLAAGANTMPATGSGSVSPTSGETWHASLRGKPLTGVQLDMPDGYVGLLCHSVSQNVGGKTGLGDPAVDLVADGDVTRQFMYWNWDLVPTRNDPLLAALDWLLVSDAMMTSNIWFCVCNVVNSQPIMSVLLINNYVFVLTQIGTDNILLIFQVIQVNKIKYIINFSNKIQFEITHTRITNTIGLHCQTNW